MRTILERELEKRRVAQLGGVGIEGLGTGERESGVDAGVEMGGLECRAPGGGVGDGVFRFSEWDGGEVGFLSSWVRVGAVAEGEKTEKDGDDMEAETDGLYELKEWLEVLA